MENASKKIRKGTPRHAYWFLTWNNPPQDWQEACKKFEVDYFIGQLEKGAAGTTHVQAMVYIKNKPTLGGCKKATSASIHLEGVRSKLAASEYVTKEDTRIDGPIEFGVSPFSAKLSSKEILESNPVELIEKGAISAFSLDRLIKNQLLYK